MFEVHQVVNWQPQYCSTDTRNTPLGHILQKISCVLQRSALDRCIYPVLAPKSVPQLLATQYTIFFCGAPHPSIRLYNSSMTISFNLKLIIFFLNYTCMNSGAEQLHLFPFLNNKK